MDHKSIIKYHITHVIHVCIINMFNLYEEAMKWETVDIKWSWKYSADDSGPMTSKVIACFNDNLSSDISSKFSSWRLGWQRLVSLVVIIINTSCILSSTYVCTPIFITFTPGMGDVGNVVSQCGVMAFLTPKAMSPILAASIWVLFKQK